MSMLMLALALQAAAPTETIVLEPNLELACHRVIDLDRDGLCEIVAIGRDGRVRTLHPHAPGRSVGSLALAAPVRSLLAFATYAETTYLVSLSPAGTSAYPVLEGGEISAQAQVWIPRARFALRIESPSLAPIAQDVNLDGLDDIVVPTLNGVELWLASLGTEQRVPAFRKLATLSVEVSRWGSHDAEYLSDSLESSFSIPGLLTRDVNGDGRPDLLVEQGSTRAFHLQREDGSFPLEADVAVDLSIFKDTTEASGFALGGTLSAGDKATCSSRDLDGDAIPDYVIGHRRKVWVFRGTKEGPQFKQPSAILKTAEDITALVVHPLDADALPDLLLVKVQIPTLATLLRGLFGEWDVQMRVLAYSNVGEGRFEGTPSLSNELAVRLPGIIGLAKNPEKVLERFTDVEKEFRASAHGDVDGDGREDVVLITQDKRRVEAWLSREGDGEAERGGQRKLRKLLFDEQNAVWDLDRMATALGDFVQQRAALLTGGRGADRSALLRDPDSVELVSMECAQLGAAGGEEIVLAYQRKGEPHSGWFEVLSFTPETK
ncbi:MAG: VCBS repeat-containing protein [Planctomycetes bacterium]|nr:VCBS repeat-containing protein [Planctomycetota bacterium]